MGSKRVGPRTVDVDWGAGRVGRGRGAGAGAGASVARGTRARLVRATANRRLGARGCEGRTLADDAARPLDRNTRDRSIWRRGAGELSARSSGQGLPRAAGDAGGAVMSSFAMLMLGRTARRDARSQRAHRRFAAQTESPAQSSGPRACPGARGRRDRHPGGARRRGSAAEGARRARTVASATTDIRRGNRRGAASMSALRAREAWTAS